MNARRLALVAGLLLGNPAAPAQEQPGRDAAALGSEGPSFAREVLTDEYDCDGINVGDFDNEGRAHADGKPRLLVLTDIGGDPDDSQSLIRLLTYADEFDIEGLVASASGTPGELKADIVRPDLIREIVDAYGQVRENLARHRAGYPTAGELGGRIKAGNPHRGVANLGEGHDTEGSRWIIAAADRPDPRPLNVAIWGGSTELAQALWRVRHDRDERALGRFLAKLRVYAVSHQDDTGPWIVENFPDLFYVLGKSADGRDKREAVYRGMYLGGDESLTSRAWIDENIREGSRPPRRALPAADVHGPQSTQGAQGGGHALLVLLPPQRPERRRTIPSGAAGGAASSTRAAASTATPRTTSRA